MKYFLRITLALLSISLFINKQILAQQDYAMHTIDLDTLIVNDSKDCSFYLKNIGNEECTGAYLRGYLSTNDEYDYFDIEVFSEWLGNGLLPGDSVLVNESAYLHEQLDTGTFNLIFVIDGGKFVDELDETNNTILFPDKVVVLTELLYFGIDFSIANVSMEDTVLSGSSIDISGEIVNSGPNTIDDIYLSFILSEDSVLDAYDYVIDGLFYPGTLAPGETYAFNEPVNPVYDGTLPAKVYIISYAGDFYEEEINSENNYTIMPLYIYADMDYDLQAMTLDATTLSAGSYINVTTDLYNGGSDVLPATTIYYYLSDDSVYNKTDRQLELDNTYSFVPDPGETDSYDARLTIPNIEPGDYYIIGLIDRDDFVLELDERNNSKHQQITVSESFNDVRVNSVTATTSTGNGGDVVSFTVEFENIGTDKVGESYHAFYISKDSVFDYSDYFFGQNNTNDLDPGEIWSQTRNIELPTEVASGDYYIISVYDYLNIIPETNTTNNYGSAQVSITNVSTTVHDLEIVGVQTPPDTIYIDESLSFRYSLRNNGDVAITKYITKTLFSQDTIPDPGDLVSLMSSQGSANYAVGQTYSVYSSVLANNSIPPGNYNVIVVYSLRENLRIEDDVTNNYVSVPIVVMPKRVIDFGVQNLVADTLYTSLQDNQISFEKFNIGDGEQAVRHKLYLSKNTSIEKTDIHLTKILHSIDVGEGETVSQTVDVNFDDEIEEGNWYLIVEVLNSYEDIDPANNFVYKEVYVSNEGIDVVASSFSADTVFLNNFSGDYSFEIENNSSLDLTDVEYSIYISEDSVYSPGWDKELITGTEASLSRLTSVTGSDSYTIMSQELKNGEYYLIFGVNPENTIEETDISNNFLSQKISFKETFREIEPGKYSINKNIYFHNDTFNIEMEVSNSGYYNQNLVEYNYYLSTDSVVDDSDTELASLNIPGGISAFTTDTINMQYVINDSLLTDTSYYILCQLDVFDEINEKNEDNNLVIFPFTVTPSFLDITISNMVTDTTELSVVDTLVVYCTIENPGNLQVDSSFVNNVYIIKDTVPTIASEVAYSRTFDSLSAETAHTFPIKVAMNDIDTGNYYFVFVTDANDSIAEKDEQNNYAYLPFHLSDTASTLPIDTTSADTIQVVEIRDMHSEVLVYPNPANEVVNIVFSGNEIQHVRLVDITGKCLIARTKNEISEGRLELNVSQLSSGMYFLILQSEESYISRKLMVE